MEHAVWMTLLHERWGLILWCTMVTHVWVIIWIIIFWPKLITVFLSVPIDVSSIKMLYVFVDIQIDLTHFVAMVKHNFPPGYQWMVTHIALVHIALILSIHKLALISTIQFAASLHTAKLQLADQFPSIYSEHILLQHDGGKCHV